MHNNYEHYLDSRKYVISYDIMLCYMIMLLAILCDITLYDIMLCYTILIVLQLYYMISYWGLRWAFEQGSCRMTFEAPLEPFWVFITGGAVEGGCSGWG